MSAKQSQLKKHLLIPIHWAERYYKKRYHLTYVHAKKLFVFDMGLLLSIFGLIGISMFWFFAEPTIPQHLRVSFYSDQKVASGEQITYELRIENTADTPITNLAVSYKLPSGFTKQDSSEPPKTLLPKQQYIATLTGSMIGEPNIEYRSQAFVSYTDKKTGQQHIATASHLITLRDSLFTLEVDAPDTVMRIGRHALSLQIKNGSNNGAQLSIPLQKRGQKVIKVTPNHLVGGSIVTTLGPGTEQDYTVIYETNLPKEIQTYDGRYQLFVKGDTDNILQQEMAYTGQIADPSMAAFGLWKKHDALTPGVMETLFVTLQNTGDLPLQNPNLVLSFDTKTISISRLRSKYGQAVQGNKLVLSFKESIPPQQEKVYAISMPIRSVIAAQNQTVELTGHATMQVAGIAGATYTVPISLQHKRIYKSASFETYALYFTPDGDQLGRGALPPTPDKETTYIIITQIHSGTEDLSNVQFSANLAKEVIRTAKPTANYASPPSISGNQIHWSSPTVPANSMITLTFRVTIIPTEQDIGTNLPLLHNIATTATEASTGKPIVNKKTIIDTSLPNDTIARSRGVVVE